LKRLSTKKWIVGIGSIIMAVVLVLVGTLKNSETLMAAEGIFEKVELLREEYWGNGKVFTILEIVPDGGATEFAYLIGEEEPYSDGDFGTETDFVSKPLEEQEKNVKDLSDRGILTEDESSSSQYPLYYHYEEFDDVVFSDEPIPELVEDDYTELTGAHLVAGTYREIIDNNGNVSYEFTPKEEITGDDVNLEATSAYLVLKDGTYLYLTFDVESGTYKETVPGSGDGNDESSEVSTGNEGETIEGSAIEANSTVNEKEIGVIENTDSVSSNEETPVEETPVEETPIEETLVENSQPDDPQAVVTPEMPAQDGNGIMATGDEFEGYGYLEGYVYTKLIKEYTVTNNEFFKKLVFAMSIDDRAEVNIDVKTVNVSDLTIKDVQSADLFYIQGGNYEDEFGVGMQSAVAYELIKRVACDPEDDDTYAEKRVPCIIDYSIYETLDTVNQNNNMYKLAVMMMSSDMAKTFDYFYNGVFQWGHDIDSDDWKTVKSFMPAEVPNNGHFVNENVYFVNGIKLVSSDFKKSFTSREIATGFAEVYNAITREKNDNPDSKLVETLIDPSIVIQYLLNFADDSMIIKKAAIKVLELQPCKTFNWDTDEKKMNFIEDFAPDFKTNPDAVEIECMTTMEFIGRNDNLNATYDLIYIGTNITNYKREIVEVKVGETSEWVPGHWEGTGRNKKWIEGYWETTEQYEESTLRKWADSTMKGLIYSHVGDITAGPWANNTIHGDRGVGLLDSHYEADGSVGMRVLRFPGNDISTHNMDDLIDYLKSGYPVIISDLFFTYDDKNFTVNKGGTGAVVGDAITGINGGNSYTVKAGNKKQVTTVTELNNGTTSNNSDNSTIRYGILDTSTNLYKVIKEAWNPSDTSWDGRKYPNMVNESGADSEYMNAYLNKQKLTLNLTQMPASYSYTTKGEFDVIKDIKYLPENEDGKYELNFEFSIGNLDSVASPNDRYTCKLFIDDNFDGKFSKTQEEVTELVVKDAATGKTVAYDDLRIGVPYTVSRVLPADYVGCIQWQLLISMNSNPYILCEETGLTAVRSKKETINILHIMDDNGNSVNLQNELQTGTSAWGQALKNVPDFEINIKSITVREYLNLLERYLWPKVYAMDPDLDIRAYGTPEDFFTEAVFDNGGTDMILMGFVDCFEELNHDVAVNAIMNYAASGRSVLFSHDMTSWKVKYREKTGTERMYRYDPTADNPFIPITGDGRYQRYDGSQYFGIRIREMSGMDMFGATINRYKGSSYANSGQGYSNDPSKPNYNMDAWNYLVGLGKDMAYKPNTEQRETVGETTGCTYIQFREATPPYIFDDGGNIWDNSSILFDNEKDKTLITQVNDGVITSYPYEIPESFTSATTHSQYYALDMEEDADKDGESDLVVWYCVAARQSDASYNKDDIFRVSPNDVRNNYYIYSMGNIIYTGMGHTTVNDKHVEEIKLFINTMVAAYRAGVKTPEVSVVESADEGADRVEFIALPYDIELLKDGVYEEAGIVNSRDVDVYFTLDDNNVIKGASSLIPEFYVNDAEVAFANYQLYDCTDNKAVTKVIDLGDNRQYYVLEKDKTYRVTLTLDYATQIAKSCEIQVQVYARVEKKNGSVNTSEKAIGKVRVGKVDMFELD